MNFWKIQIKKQILIITALIISVLVSIHQTVKARQDSEKVTLGKTYYRNFLVDNVYHSKKNGDIHYNAYFPDSYDGKRKWHCTLHCQDIRGYIFKE